VIMKEIILDNEKTEKLQELVKPYLTEKRYAHTLSVMKEAVKLGKLLLPDEPEKINKLAASALLHDITKKDDTKRQLQYCEEFGIIIDESEMFSPAVFHAFTGAEVAKRDFSEFTDDEILAGIRWHTTGRDGMTIFEAIIFLADYIEETRTFDDCIAVRKYFYDKISSCSDKIKVLRDTMIYAFDLTIKGIIDDGGVIDSHTVAARNYFIISEKNNSNL
jgi:predicted HD superfamily hydrolase involved in NAD metabolism